ncbi:unnamed protein product [Urochloa humidicola]
MMQHRSGRRWRWRSSVGDERSVGERVGSPLHPPRRRLHFPSFLLRPDTLLLGGDTREMEAAARAAGDGDRRRPGCRRWKPSLRGRAPTASSPLHRPPLPPPTSSPPRTPAAGISNSSFFFIYFQLEH